MVINIEDNIVQVIDKITYMNKDSGLSHSSLSLIISYGALHTMIGNDYAGYVDAHNPKYGDPVTVPLSIATEDSIKEYGRYIIA